jgi:hypothetical protein
MQINNDAPNKSNGTLVIKFGIGCFSKNPITDS